jgi:hypothetical protein
MDGYDLPIELLEDYVSKREYGGDIKVELRERSLHLNGTMKVCYEMPRGVSHPTIVDIVLSKKEVDRLVKKHEKSFKGQP